MMKFHLGCRPAFNYARDRHAVRIISDGACFLSPQLHLGLATRLPLTPKGEGVVSDFVLREGESATLILQDTEPEAGCGAGLSEEEATAFMHWLEARCAELNPDGSLQIMYGIDGRHALTEEHLDHLEGYRGSKPVRIGNGAYRQLQLDIYGELMDSVYLYNKHGSPISYDLWRHLDRLMDYVAGRWDQPDEGIWEIRSGRQDFVYSKLMCWVAFDRALRLADKRSFPADRQKWLACRDALYHQIMTKGWDEKRQTFVQFYGGRALDAANLLMPLVFFVSPDDPRMLKTLDAVLKSPEQGGLVSNSLVYRYNVRDLPDGFDEVEGTFNMCTFWLVEAMARAGRSDPEKLDTARLIFEQMLGYSNHLGLFAEETGPSGEALGNFPQAFTHLALISAAFNLDRALGNRR